VCSQGHNVNTAAFRSSSSGSGSGSGVYSILWP